MKKNHAKKENTNKNEEDVTLNLSWIKNIFSRKDKEKKTIEDKSNNEDVSIDFKSIFKILSKYSIIFLILIPIILSVYIRTIPEKMTVTDTWAKNGIYNNIKSNIASEISKQYPNLPSQNMQSLVNEQFNLVLNQQNAAIEQAITQQSQLIKDQFRDNQGYTYLGDIDSYFWLRYAQNIVEKGKVEDESREGIPYDNHMNAPVGFKITDNIYPYIIAYLYRFLKIFNPKITLMQASFYTPLFLSFFAIIAAFFIGKRLSGNLAGFIAAILIAVNPTILSRSLGSDNDIVNAVFPLIIMLFTLYAFDNKDIKKTGIYAIILGALIGVYSFAWSGWWFLFLFIIGAAVIYVGYNLLYEILNNKKKIVSLIKDPVLINTSLFILIFIIVSFFSLTLFGNQGSFFSSFLSPLKITTIKAAARGVNLWPNVYTTVAELNEANLSQIIGGLGGAFSFWIALMGGLLSLIIIKTDKKGPSSNLIYFLSSGIYYALLVYLAASNNIGVLSLLILITLPLGIGLFLSIILKIKIDPRHSLLMIIWFVSTIYAATKGVRFILLIVPAFSISFAVFFGNITELLSNMLSKSLDISKYISKTIFILVALLFLLQPIQNGYATSFSYIPSVNDGWVQTLTKIKQESSPNAIINSWWDFGHWFKYFADRAVTSDGASQNSPQAHWIGKVLLTDNEKEAISILNMLDCGSNNAYTLLNSQINDSYNSIIIIYRLLSMEKKQAREELLKIVSQNTTDAILDSMFCEPPEDYFITSEDMVGKSGVWAHFGSWDFRKAEFYKFYQSKTYEDFVKALIEKHNYTEEEAKRTYYEIASLTTDSEINNWIAPWPGYGGVVSCSKNKEGNLLCNIPASNSQVIPLQINLTSKESFIYSSQGTFYPNALGYLNGEEYKIKRYNNGIGYAVVLLEDNSSVLVTGEELVGSIFTRLFYLNGKGLQHFKKFNDIRDVTGSRIITWKLSWPE